MDVKNENIELKELKAKDYQMGQYISFDMDEVEKMDPVQLNNLMSRQYKWKDVSNRDMGLNNLVRLIMYLKNGVLKI